MFILWLTVSPLILNCGICSRLRHNIMDEVFTNLTIAMAQSTRKELSSSVSQGALPGLALGSAGSKAGNDVGAATSYGLSRVKALEISLGVSAAQSRTAEAISRMFHSRITRQSLQVGYQRRKRRSSSSAATSLNEVSGPGVIGNIGSSGVQAGPVATAISLGTLLAELHHSVAAINGGATAAHAGRSDSSTTFSNSNLDGNSESDYGDNKKKDGKLANEEKNGEVANAEKDGEVANEEKERKVASEENESGNN